MASAIAMLPAQPDDNTDDGTSSSPRARWFGGHNCVQDRGDDEHDVFIGGNLIGAYRDGDVAQRDALMVLASTDKRVGLQDVAAAFRVSKATVQLVRAKYRKGGLGAIVNRRRRGPREKVTPRRRAQVFAMFEQGVSVRGASRAVKALGYGSVQRLYAEWKAQQVQASDEPTEAKHAAADVLELFGGDHAPTSVAENDTNDSAGVEESCTDEDADGGLESPDADLQFEQSERTLEEVVASGDKQVQHAGTWIALAMLCALGTHQIAQRLRGGVGAVTLRVALDAVAVALTLGAGCVEGVRRIATPSAGTLLRSKGAVSASWVRRTLGRFADKAGTTFHLAMAKTLAERASAVRDDGRVVLYVDNHLRPYTGKFTVRKGWRMQDKKAVPGTSDYTVHDESGRPLFRVDVPSHGSLTAWLRPIARFVRSALGKTVKPLLVFDRGGAFPNEMAALRDEDFEFLTYERAPYPTLSVAAFDRSLELTLPSKPTRPIRIGFTDAPDKNLRRQRGRVRRIALRMPDGNQINILTCSTLPAEELIPMQLLRWGRQENQFKHGVERWGINQLDGRKVELYPEGTIIPNPARRKLDQSLHLARAAEGQLRRKLARVGADEDKRVQLEQELERNLAVQRDLEDLRPHVPTHAPVEETELANKLVRHDGKYKTVIDTLRIALANIESDLASELAATLVRPREAKKTLANLLSAPGTVHLTSRTINVALAPAGSASERESFRVLLHSVNSQKLVLPGDPSRRKIRFSLQE